MPIIKDAIPALEDEVGDTDSSLPFSELSTLVDGTGGDEASEPLTIGETEMMVVIKVEGVSVLA